MKKDTENTKATVQCDTKKVYGRTKQITERKLQCYTLQLTALIYYKTCQATELS